MILSYYHDSIIDSRFSCCVEMKIRVSQVGQWTSHMVDTKNPIINDRDQLLVRACEHMSMYLATGVRCSAVMVEGEELTKVYRQSWIVHGDSDQWPSWWWWWCLCRRPATWPQGSSGQDDEVRPQLESPSQASICLFSFSPTLKISIGLILDGILAPVDRRGRWRSTAAYRKHAKGTWWIAVCVTRPKTKYDN